MALQLKGCLSQSCDGFSYKDITGPYNADTNNTGYGSPNEVDGPSDFSSYELRIWDPTNNYYSDTPVATATLDLLDDVPTPDSEGFYTWDFTAADIDLTAINDGVWFWEVVGIKDDIEYPAQGFALFINTLRGNIDTKLKTWDPTCPCKKGCQDPGELYAQFLVLECGGVCDPAGAADVIKWLTAKLKLCC